MPARQSNVGGLVAKLGDRLRQAHEAHRNDETEFNAFSNLPPGINEGVAELEDCEFQIIKEGKNGAGEYQLYASGIVHAPIEHEWEDPPGSKRMKRMKVEGLRTFIVEPMYDLPGDSKRARKSVDDHVKFVYNLFRQLGYNTAQMEFDQLEDAAAALRDAKPLFKFRTWRGQATEAFPNPIVSHFWDGLVDDDYQLPEAEGQEVDNTVAKSAATATNVNGKQVKPLSSPKPATTATPPPADLEFGDLDSLLKLAEGKDGMKPVEAARIQLTDMAIATGKTQEEVDNAESWQEVVDWLRANDNDEGAVGSDEEPEPEEEPEAPAIPEKGDVVKTRLLGSDGKKGKKLIQVEVMKVDTNKSICEVKNLTDKKIHKGIPFADLVSVD